jgi:hypothetical protein
MATLRSAVLSKKLTIGQAVCKCLTLNEYLNDDATGQNALTAIDAGFIRPISPTMNHI